ncbi:caspase family protein [Sphingomonas sp. BIUV-7]|uniref:Caspase family protein n=1 Tax=Sphingomonas natans TaxID=3063330 RepID=A0ABT8YB20_9SPHN|nr:caspase family protein [Sphingomonas sp. BIUV-7]MDO6415197.1 caspase family protein [Sphingomonas sp. BIUV-7]
MLLTAALAAAASISAPAFCETRALLLGVSHYSSPSIHDLVGPANDVAAMESLARSMGATDVVTLKDGEVSRSKAEHALQAMGARAKPGDWVLLYYSGHGAQARARVATTEDGAFDQFVPLAGFDPDHQDPERFIVDKDFYTWLKRYVPSDVRVLMLVDSCHSGTMHRAVDTRAFGFTPRLAFRGEERAFELVARPGPQLPGLVASSSEPTDERRDDLPNLVYIGASRDDQLALEVPLPQQGAPSRGVLTYAFESALSLSTGEGGTAIADLDGDGRVSVLELSTYLNSQVRMVTAQRQESTTFFPPGWSDLPILSSLPPRRPMPLGGPVAVAMFRGQAPAVPPEVGWHIVGSAGEADFLWDAVTGDVLRRSGDLVASAVTSVGGLNGVVAKWRAVQTLAPFVSELNTRLVIEPAGGDIVYSEHAKVSFDLARTAKGNLAGRLYATVFNLGSDGTIQLLYPLGADGDGEIRSDVRTLVLQTEVVPPFGTDHAIAITTPHPPNELRAALRTIDGQRAGDSLSHLIIAQLRSAKNSGSLSIVESYSGN